MICASVAAAILTRLKTDSTLWDSIGGAWQTLIAGGIWFSQGDPTTRTLPYGVFTITENHDPTFTTQEAAYSLEFNIYDNPPGQQSDGLDSVVSIESRIHGDAMLQAGRVPSYGLDRHKLTIPTNYLSAAGGQIMAESCSIGPDDENHVVLTMTFSIKNIAANAVTP